jgi:hypothetical protein
MTPRSEHPAALHPRPRTQSASSLVPAEAAPSFLKDTKGAVSWSPGEMAAVLTIPKKDADQVIALLEAQGYIARAENNQWMTTAAGESVSGAKMPRFGRQNVEEALKSLKGRITGLNKDKDSPYKIAAAVAFGDFLLQDRAKVQPADVGVRLLSRGRVSELRSASDAKAEASFLKDLRGKMHMLTLRPYADWMSKRLHRKLI